MAGMMAAFSAASSIPHLTKAEPITRRAYYYTKLNRAKRWPYASTYTEARTKSPCPERPVR